MSNSLWPHGLQYTRPPCPSSTPRAYSNSHPLSQWCHPTISSSVIPFSPAFNFPSIRVSSNQSVLRIRWLKYWSFIFSISPSKEYSGPISFRMDWLDLFVVQGTLKRLLQHHSSKASILWHSAFFIVQLSHPYMTTGKTKALTKMDLCWQMGNSRLSQSEWGWVTEDPGDPCTVHFFICSIITHGHPSCAKCSSGTRDTETERQQRKSLHWWM